MLMLHHHSSLPAGLLQVCKQHAIHPHNPQEAAAHRNDCSELSAKLAKRVRDSTIECGICLEKVLSKPQMSQRRFGLMACEHAFCINCIRSWRATGEVDAKTVRDRQGEGREVQEGGREGLVQGCLADIDWGQCCRFWGLGRNAWHQQQTLCEHNLVCVCTLAAV